MSFGQEVAYERTFHDRQAAVELLAWLGDESPRKDDAATRLSVVEVLHEAQIVQLSLEPLTDVLGLADVESLETAAPLAPEDVHAGSDRELVEVDQVRWAVPRGSPHGDRVAPFDLQFHRVLGVSAKNTGEG
jgi:hypothetical protein